MKISEPTLFGRPRPHQIPLQNSHTVTSDSNRVMVHRVVMLFTAMPGPQPSARVAADPRTVRLALELLKRTSILAINALA